MTEAILPGFLSPTSSHALVRLGRDHDGGYLVDARDIAAADCLISLGINDDWSFDRSFVRYNHVPVSAYDGSISSWKFGKQVLRDLLEVRHLGVVLHSARCLADYLRFFAFSRRNRHFKCFVGNDGRSPNVTMGQIFETTLHRDFAKPFLKIDIEGAEYGLLDELVDRAGCTCGLVIEFHDCDTHLGAIQRFIEGYPLRLVHVHANNYGSLNAKGFPKVLELTFSSSVISGFEPVLPHPLDMPNDRGAAEIALSFAKESS